ncbi:hypothetical protein ECG_08145 [Echinococcus granulosus]|nr:hypothetical protein ECG_08145 [Echinococcus granulosus]
MLQPLDVEHCLASLSKSIPTLQWWRFKLSKSDRQRHIWISLPANVEVVCGKTSLLPKNSQLLGRLNILHYGADCLIQGVRVTPSEEEQIVCIETRASEQDPRIFWIDVNQLAVVISPNGIQEIVDISKPTLPLRGSHTWGWLSGLEVPSSKSQLITERCFLIPVDFSNRDDIAVLLSRNTKSDRLSLSESFSPSQKLIVVNPQTNKLYSCRLDSMRTSQTYSPFENMGSFSEVDGIKDSEKAVVSEDEEDGELAFPASMMDEEATKRDTKLSETLVEIEDFLGRVIWTIQHSSDGCVGRDTNVENQRCRIEMQLAEMQSCEEDLQIYESNASLSLLEKLLGILTCLLEISEMVNMHRRRDESSILRLVDQKLSDLTLWLDKSQSGEGSIPLPQARHALNQLACIQSAVRIFVGTAKPGVNLEATIEKVELWVGERLESEIHEKLAEGTPCQGISLKVGDVLTAFSESMKEHLPLLPTSVVSQLETPSTPLETLQLIRSNLAENMTFLKDRCGWIPCILSEGVQRKLNISQGLIADLRAIHNHAFTTYKQLEMYTPLVCEHSGLYALAVRLTNVLERSTDEKLSQWEISQLEQDLDRCEAECAVEILSSSKENREFITMVVRSLLEYTSVARKIVNGIYTIQEPQLSEWLERLNFLTSTSNRPCSSSFFEALLIGWYLQTRSFADSQMDELVCQLEQEVSASFQDTPLVHLRISEMEEFLSRTPPICTPCNAEASSLRSTLQILSDVILRLNSAVQLLERMAFLTNLHPSQRLKTLRFAYPRALEGLTRCFRALDALLRELAEWRKCIILVEDSDQRDTATQAVIEVVNFAMDVITQELQRVSTVEFFNAPDFLSQILAWLSSFHASLIGFRKAICQYRLEKSAICSHSSALLQDLLNLEWLITDSRLQSSRDMTRDVGGTAAGYIKTSWMASIQKILAEIEPTKRRRLLNLLEGMERSSRERRRSLLGLLLGSREPVKIFEGVTMLNYIVARTEGFTDLEVQALEEKYAGTEDYQSNGYEKPNSNVCEETFYTLMRNLSEEFRHIYNKQGGICDELKVAECLRKSEILVNIGRQCVATSRSSLHFINRVLFSHWPEALLKLITTGQLREGKNSPPDWRICALDFRNTVARCLVKGSFGFEKEGLPQVGTKVVDESLGNLRMAIEEADRIFHGIHDGFSVETEDVWQACLRLHDLFQSYTSQLRQQISDLTLPSLSAIKKDLQHLDGRLNKLAQDGSSPSALDDCSHSVAHLEESLQALRQTARILFTCLSTDSQPSSKVTPSKHLDVNELYRRAVKLVNDYEASEIGCQILEAWQQLQSIADKLGRLQAGLPLTESFTTYEAMTTQSPMTSTSDIHVDGFSSASMARKRSWSLLEILGSHECLYPGCRGKKSEKHEIQAMNDGLLHDLHSFYSLLCSEFHDRAMRIPVEVLTSSTQEAASSEIALLNLRQEWYRNVGLVNQFNSLHRRVKLDGSGRSEVRSSFALIEDIWGEATPLKAVFEATERLATVSSWLCEVERYLELDVLPRLQTAWKKSSEDDTLSVVEEYVYKMNEVAEDLEDLEKSGILAERHLKTVKHSLQAGWFSVREFLLNRCVEPAFHEDPTSVRYFPLVDDFLRHSVGLGFQDCDLKAIHTRLCNQYLFHGLPQREHHPVPGGRKFCSTHRSLRSLFLPAWLTERCRIVQHRPPVALTIHSIPDIYTEAYPPLSSTAELAFYSPNCIALQSQRWLSLPNIRSQSPTRREVKKNSFLMTEDELALNSPQPKLNEVEMKTSQPSFSVLPSEDERTEVEEKEEPTISEDPGNSALMRDVRLLLAQLKSQGSQMTQIMDVNGTDTKSEPNESEESKEEECSTILTPPECAVSKKVRDKSPITWCTVYLPNDEATELSAYPETVTERGVIRMASDPLLPKREPYAPMVFSAPHEASDQEGGEFTEEVSGDVEGMVECSPSTTLDESGVCDWLQNQQGENIRRLMNEYGADEYDGDKADISLSAADNPSVASDRLDVLLPRTKSSVCDSFEESGFVDDEWLRRSHELPAHKTRDSIFVGDTEGHLLNQTKRGGVNWGPLVARPESPHLSVIAEVSADESTLEKHQCFNEKLQKPSQVYEEEKHVGDGEWKTAAPKKTRSSSNRAAKKMDEEEEERTEGFTSPSPKIPTFWDSEDKHGAPTPTQTSFGAKDGIQPQEGDSEEEIDKTISEVLPLEVRVDGYESAASLQINMKSSSDSVGDPNTEVEEKEEPTISEDPGNSALMRDVRLLLAQLKSQGSQMTQIMDVNGTDTKSEPNESEESKEEECSTILTPPECAVSKKVRDKSPITWCTVYLPNDEATELSAYPETVTERGVIRMASDPLLPKREPYAPMVFSAPHEASDQEGGEFTQEEVSGDVEGMVECSPSTTLDESGVCDWLQNQQGENIRRLMNEYGADEYDGDKADISLTAADDPSTASGLLEMPNPRTKNSICDSFEESGFADDEWLRRSHELPTQKTNNSLLSSGTNDFSFDEIKGGRVNWGPLVERPESPHLSVISEASTDGSTLEKQKCIDEKLQKSSQEVSEAEEPDDSSEWKTVAPKKTRSRSNRAAKKMGEEEEERTEEFTSFSLRIPTFWDSEDKHDAPTKTQTSLVVKDGIQPQEGDSDGETDKTISEVLPSEVRVNENESAKSLQKIMESSSDSVCGPNIKAEPFYEEMVEQGAELVDGNAIERQDTELCAAIKTFLQTTGKDENGFKEEPQSPEDGILEKTTFVEVGSEDVSEPRDEAEINLVQRDAGRDYRQRSQEVNFSVDERPPVEQTDTSEVNEQSGRGDFNSHLGKVGVNETNNEKISLNSTKSSTKPKRKLKKSRKKNSSEDPSTRVVSKPPSWNNVHRSAKFEGTDAITDGPSSTEQEVQILNEYKKGGNLLNGFQNAGKYDRGVATKPLAKKRKYRELINVREVSNSEGLPASKESGDVLSAVHAKFNHKAQIGVNIPEDDDNLFDSTVVDVDEGQFASEFIYDGLLVYDLQPDDEVKEEAKLEQKCNGGVEVEKAKTDTKDARSSLQKKNWVVKAAESLLEEVHPVDVDEPIDPAVLSSKLDHHQMDQHCIDEGVVLKNKEVLLISSHLWEGEAKKGILHEVDLTKWSDEKDAKRGQSVEPIDDTKDDNTFIPTLKENACQDPEQSVALTTEMDKDRSCPEDANSTKKRKTKPKKGDRKERDLDRKSGNKEAVLSENLAVSDKVRVGNEAVSPANEFNAYVDKDGLEIKPKLQSDLSDLDEDLLRHLEENVHSGGRKIEIQGGDMDTLEETSTEDKGLESNGLGTVDTWNDLLSSKEFEIYSKEEKGKRITVKMDHLEGFGSEDVLRECTNEDAESQGHLAEARDSSDEIYQSGTIQRVDASSSSKAPEVPSIKGGKKKRHQRGRHIVSEVEVEECTTSTVPASREMSIIDAEVDHKASEVAAGVGHLMQPEEAKGALDIIGDGQEASKQIHHQHVAGKLNDQLEDESQVNECDPEAGGETVDELRAVAEANVMKNLNEGEEGEHLQYEHATEGVGGELQPQTSQDTMRWEDSEFQEHPVEGPDRLDEFDQSETIQRVDALSSPEVSEVPSIKSGKKKSKRHRKERHPFVVKVEAQTLDSSTVLPATVMADLNDEAELKITEAFVDEQEFASDLLKEPQPIHHEVVVKELPEHPEDRFQINDSKSDVQDESADESRAVGETSNLVSGYESKQHSAEQEKREKYFEEGGERTQDERDVEDGSDESQPRANEEALKMSTDEGVETPNDLIEGEGYVNEIVEPESNPIFGALSASQEHEGISVRGEGKKRRRKERYFQDEGEVETLEATADVGYPLEPEDDTKTKNIATNGKEFASGGSEEVSQPSEHDLMEKETPGDLGDEAQSIKHKLEVQGMSADGSKPHLTEENEKNWDNEEREHWQGEGGNVGDEDELRPQENEDIWSETTDERDAKPFKRPTEGEDNVNKIADPATIQGVDTLSSSQESETPPVKSKTKKQHRKKKQLLSEVEMVVGVEPPIQTEEDKSALDVVVGGQGSVLGIGKHSQPNEQEFAVKESFIYLEGKPQTDECNLEVQRDLVNESRGIGEVDELLQLDECEPHLGQKEKERKHREEGKHWPGESEFEGVGDKSQVLTNEEDDEESCNSRLKVGDDIAEIVGAETPRTTDVLPSSQEPEGLSMKIGERSQHPEDSYLQNGTGAQKLETSTAFSLKELSGMVDEGEFETARTAVDEQRKEHHEEEEGEDLLNESNVEGVGDDLRPQTNKGILQECTKDDVESQKHPAQARYGSDKIDKFETTYGVVILSSPEESEASSMKGGKKKRHRKKRHLMNKAEVEECTASTVLASQEMSIMDAEADLKTPEAAPGVGYSLQSEEAKSASDIIVDGQEPVSDIEKQPIVILEGASPPIRHEFVENKSTDYPEDESQINECELVVEEELVNELKTVDKANDIEHFHVPRAHSEEQGKKKWHRNEGEKWQKKRGTDTIGKGEDSLNVASKSEAIQDIGAMASSLEPETLSIRGEKGRKQRKKAFPQDEGVIQSAETVAEDENTLIITTEDGASSYGLLKKVTRSNVLKESSDCWEDVAQSRKYALEDQNEIVDGSRAIDEADELEAHPGGQERMQIHGEVEHCLNKSGVGDADDVLQLQRNKETMREFTDEGEKTNKSPTKGGDNVELIVESEVVQGVEAVSRSQEPDPHSLKRGRRAKHRKGRHPNAEAEAQECVTSTVPAIQGMAGANDEADLKVSEVAADVGYLMQPEEGKCTLDVTVEEEKSASDALEEIPQSNEQELVEGKMEDGLHSNQFKWEISGMTVDEFKTVCQSDDLVHSHETDKKPWKQDEKLSHSEVGELWHDELCLEGVANATQPQTDARDLKDFTDEAAGSQENLRKGEIVASEAIPSVDTLPSSQKLGSPSINRKEKAEIEEESHQKGNSISSPEDQLSQKKGKTDLDSVVGGHLSTPQIYPDDQLKSNLDEFAGSDDLSNQHVKSDDEASQPRFEVREVPSHQGKKKPPRAEFSSDDYRDEKVSNLWTPSLPPPGSARETVTKDGLEIPGGRDDQFANCEPYSANSVGEKSQALDFATTEDLTVAVEYTHSPFMKNSPKVDNLPCLSQDLSHDSDEDPSQTDNTMENEETVAVIGRRSTQEEMPMSVDISEPLNGRTLKLKPSQESKESSKKKDKKRKHPKEKSPECGEPLEVVDVEIDERPPPEHESEAASTKRGKKKKKHQREKYLKNVHTAEEDSKSLSTETKVENHPADKVVLGGEHVQITSTAPTSREGSESFAEQVDKSNVPSVSLGTEGRSPVSKMEMELQKQPTAGSDVDRANEDGKKSNQEGYNLECNPELQNTEAEENLTENNLKQIESWKESELKECPGATTLETVGPNVTTSIPILGETKEDNQRAKELSRNSEAQGKDEKELELSRSPDVDANKEQDDQQLKEVDNPFVSMEEEGEISLEEFPGLNELEFCQNHRKFGENSIDTGSKFHEANLSPNPDEEAIPVAVADEQAWKDEERLENRVGDVSDKYFELSLHPVKDVDVLEDLFVSKVSEASVNHSTSQKPPKSAMPRKESHQGSEITTLSDSIPSTVDVGIDDLQETESVKSIQKENKEEDFEESSSPHFYSSTAGDCSVLVAEEEKEELPPYDSTYETEVYRPELICTGLPFPQELGGKAAEANRGKKKRWRKVSTTKDTEEYLTPAVEADEQPECVKPVDETLIPVDADTSQVVGADKDLVNKDISQQKDVGSASRELDSGGRVQGTVTGVKTEEAFSLEPNKRQEEKGKTAKGECSSTINPPEMSHLSNNGQRWPVNLQEMEREGTDVATDPQQSLGIEVPVEVIHPEMTSTPKGEDLLSSKSSTEIIQPSDVVTSSHPSSTRKKYVNKEPCVEVDIESGRQVENVEEAEEEEEDEGPVTSTDHSFTLIEQSPSDTDEVDDFTVVVKSPAPRTIIEAEAPAELITIPSESLQIRVKRRRLRWPCLFLLLLLFLLFFLIPTIIFFCITVPDFCFLPGPCPGLTLRQQINTYIHEFHRQRMPPFPT